MLKNIKSRLEGNAKGEKGQNYALAGRKQCFTEQKTMVSLNSSKTIISNLISPLYII